MIKMWKRVLSICTATVGGFVLAVDANAQCWQTGDPNGPDVICGDINGTANYTASGSFEAVSLGTTSCNIGNVWVNWISGGNQHPVIGGNLYRSRVVSGARRFEQVGQSWLKHSFFALSQTLCCANCSSTDGSHLGVGCSDPYTPARNGTQSSLGPKYQVNAHTGFYPTTTPPHPTGGNNGRCEVEIADLEVSSGSVKYYAECTYISADDAAAGNNNNNTSWRGISVTGSGSAWTFGVLGSTTRQQIALNAWQLDETGVTVQSLPVPTEGGLLFLGSKVTSLGGGQYHYEYALYNMNSDLSAGSFSIPIPGSVTVTNINFHDVSYRAGDGGGGVNYDGTDWPGTLAGGALTWGTTPYATNQNANAIRWGTTYNFRFDANAAPSSGTITIGTFKNASSFTTTGEVPGASAPGSPFCFGDGSGTFCPCTNLGNPGRGCANSTNSQGALLTSAGTTSPDTVVLTATDELASALSIVLQGDANAAPGVFYGDGVRCAGGNLKRLYIKSASSGTVVAPNFGAGDPNITTRSAALGDTIPPGGTRYYQIYYRDAVVSFCDNPPGNTYNITNGQIVVW